MHLSGDDLGAVEHAGVVCMRLRFAHSERGVGDHHACRITPALEPVIARAPGQAILEAPLSDTGRFTAYAAMYALGRQAELPSAERVRFALEFSIREQDDEASSRVQFAFGEPATNEERGKLRQQPWPRTIESLAGELTSKQTAALLPYLEAKMSGPRWTALACSLAIRIGDQLGPEARPVLERTGRCPEALANLRAAERYATGPFEFNTRVGVVVSRARVTRLLLPGPEPRVGSSVDVVRLGTSQTLLTARIVGRRQGGLGDHAILSLPRGEKLDDGEVAIGVVAPPRPLQLRSGVVEADLDGDGVAERFRFCAAPSGAFVSVWSGQPLDGELRWRAWAYLDHEAVPRCGTAELARMKDGSATDAP